MEKKKMQNKKILFKPTLNIKLTLNVNLNCQQNQGFCPAC